MVKIDSINECKSIFLYFIYQINQTNKQKKINKRFLCWRSNFYFNSFLIFYFLFFDFFISIFILFLFVYFLFKKYQSWVVGRKWKGLDPKFNVTTQSQCESLQVCKVGNKLVNGSCDTSTNCVGLCPTCKCKNILTNLFINKIFFFIIFIITLTNLFINIIFFYIFTNLFINIKFFFIILSH